MTEAEAGRELRAILEKPLTAPGEMSSVDDFDPWDIFPLYGSYSSAFDDMALQTLTNLRDGHRDGEGLAHEMFREILCVKNLCDYGTSPRVCFPTTEFEELLPAFIEKWERYYERAWGTRRSTGLGSEHD